MVYVQYYKVLTHHMLNNRDLSTASICAIPHVTCKEMNRTMADLASVKPIAGLEQLEEMDTGYC